MKKKILLLLVLPTFLLAIFAGEAFATNKSSKDTYPASTVLPLVGAESEPPISFGPTPMMYETNQPGCGDINPDFVVNVIQIDQWGSTYYDYQKNGSMGRMIAVGPGGHRQMVYHETRGIYGTSYPRWVSYNCKSPLDTWLYGTAGRKIAGGSGLNAGYTTIGVLHNGREVVIYHQMGTLGPWSTALRLGDGTAYICQSTNNFNNAYDVPDSITGSANDGIWPKMGILYDATVDTDYIHVVASEGITSGGNQHLIYTRCHLIAGGNMVCEWPFPNGESPGNVTLTPNVQIAPRNRIVATFGECPGLSGQYPNTISVVAVTSPVSKKVAIVFTNKRETGTGQYNNDVYYFESTNNGTSWFPQYGGTWPPAVTNITHYAHDFTERAYTDVAACYDYNDKLHIVWNTVWIDSVAGLISDDGKLYHWSQATGISTIASGYWDGAVPGGWNQNISKPSISALDPIYHPGGNPDSVFLFVTWTQFNGDNMSNPDNSAAGYTNGEIYAAVCNNAGQTWTPGFNLTGTHTDGCTPGTCLSEHWSSLAENMYDGDLHIEYVCDKDAGGAIQGEGAYTDDPMMYLHIEPPSCGGACACGLSYTLVDPSSFSIPPIKVSPTASRTILLELEGIYSFGGQYQVLPPADGRVTCVTNCGPTTLNPGEEKTVEFLITCGGTGFINTQLVIVACKNTPSEDTIKIPLIAVCSNDYYECRRDPKTILQYDNGICSLWTTSNTVQMLWDRRINATDMGSKRDVYAASPFAATITAANDTVVGIEESDKQYTGARDTIHVNRLDQPSPGTCRIERIFVKNTYLWFPKSIPQDPVWYWISLNQQIVVFKDKPGYTCEEWKKEQILKQVWVKQSTPPNWWPYPGSYTGHNDIYYGYWADIDAPSDTGCNSCNTAGYDVARQMIWQHGRGLVGGHPEYSDQYVGLALTTPTGGVVTPIGVQDVKNNVYIYPHSGWVMDSLYLLAATAGVNIQDPDSVVDRTAVVTAGKIDAGGSGDIFSKDFILIEATIKGGTGTGLAELQAHIDLTRSQLIPYLNNLKVWVFPVCGDCNGDGVVNSADIACLINYLFINGPPSLVADVNGDGNVNSADVAYLINYLFVPGSPAPKC